MVSGHGVRRLLTIAGNGLFQRPLRHVLLAATLLLVFAALVRSQVARLPDRPSKPVSTEAVDEWSKLRDERRAREGTEIVDRLGHFRLTGDRVTFFTDDGTGRLVGLENLNLQRIARSIADNPRQLRWKVTGTITEYRGANFLLIRQAILKEAPLGDGGYN